MGKRKLYLLAVCLLTAAVFSAGCMQKLTGSDAAPEIPEISKELRLNEEGIPIIQVYNLKEETHVNMDIESYVAGVLAGEMKNDWPEEALKAQAVLARTFVMKFLDTKTSKYDGADISTDITEAQAYAEGLVNDRILKAVSDTRGMIVSYDGEIAHTWFHAHSGGVTELPKEGLEYKENPPYTKSVKGMESTAAPKEVIGWSIEFSDEEVLKALRDVGFQGEKIESIEIGEKGKSERAATLLVNGKSVPAASFRIALGSDKLKSTLFTDISKTETGVRFEGRGYGHGVGLSQWGAYAMAENGKTYDEIIRYYFKDIDLVKLWN